MEFVKFLLLLVLDDVQKVISIIMLTKVSHFFIEQLGTYICSQVNAHSHYHDDADTPTSADLRLHTRYSKPQTTVYVELVICRETGGQKIFEIRQGNYIAGSYSLQLNKGVGS